MKKIILIIIIFLSLVYNGFSYINISDCTVIDDVFLGGETEVRLNQSILNSSVTKCIDIQSNNVVFDCQGHKIQGNGLSAETGLHIYSDNQTIKNCIFENWDNKNIYVYASDNIYFENITSSGAYRNYGVGGSYVYGYGMMLYGNNIIINNSHIYNNSVDISFYIFSACNNKIINVTGTGNLPILFFNQSSIEINNWHNNFSSMIFCKSKNINLTNISSNNINDLHPASENRGTAIILSKVENSNIKNININSTKIGILTSSIKNLNYSNLKFYNNYLGASFSNYQNYPSYIYNLTANNNLVGIQTYGSDNYFIDSSFSNNNLYGVYSRGSKDNYINCSFIDNRYGIYFYGSSNDNYVNNSIYENNINFGIKIYSSSGNNISNSLFNGNKNGIEITTSDPYLNNLEIFGGEYGLRLDRLVGLNLSNSKIYNNTYKDIYYKPTSNIYCDNINFYNVTNDKSNSYLYYNTQTTLNNIKNISSLTLCDADGSVISNITINNSPVNQSFPITICHSENIILDYINSSNCKYGLDIYVVDNLTIRNSNFNNNYNYGIYASSLTNSQILNSTIKNNGNLELYLSGSNNYIYNNILTNKIYSQSNNYFNYTIPGVGSIGNYWDEFSCSANEYRGEYLVCIDPVNYTVHASNNIYDFAPLINYVAPPERQYISPTPKNNQKTSSTNFTIKYSSGTDTDDANISINGINYSMTNLGGGIWSYTNSTYFNNSIEKVSFKIYFNGGELGVRYFTHYPIAQKIEETLPAMSIFSLLVSIIIIILF